MTPKQGKAGQAPPDDAFANYGLGGGVRTTIRTWEVGLRYYSPNQPVLFMDSAEATQTWLLHCAINKARVSGLLPEALF
jgi:hypothetical protein